jgi:hypothetical protein
MRDDVVHVEAVDADADPVILQVRLDAMVAKDMARCRHTAKFVMDVIARRLRECLNESVVRK